MNDLRLENMILKQQVWDLAVMIDPQFWEAVIRESGAMAAEKVNMDLKDAKTSPSIKAQTVIQWRPPGCVVERMGIK